MEEFPTPEPPADPWRPISAQSIWSSDCPGAPKVDQSMPDLDVGHVNAPFVLEGSQYVCLWGSFFNVLWAWNFAFPGPSSLRSAPIA
eukprot:2043931-Alexandrium_andersonii.AAC.1